MRLKKLTVEQEREIVRRWASGESQQSLANYYQIDRSRISRFLQTCKSQLHGGSAIESVASFYQQSSHLQGVFQNKVMPIKLSDEQELEVA